MNRLLLPVIALLVGAPVAVPVAARVVSAEPHLKVDPLLVLQAKAVWDIVAGEDNPVWPGWDATDTPILLYLPGEQDLLINHPNPPEGFTEYTGHHPWPGATLHVRDGETQISLDGQNTTTDVGGVRTLVVADTLSNLRNQVKGNAGEVTYRTLRTDPMEQMSLIVHEAFHVHQDRNAPEKLASELSIRQYPTLSVANNVGFAREALAMAEGMRATTKEDVRAAALKVLMIRQDRRAELEPAIIAYEDGNEFAEGLAKFTELKLFESLEGREPAEAMWLAQGFAGYDETEALRERRINQMVGFMSGAMVVNNDPYGASPVRFRLYFSGMGLAALLDEFSDTWHTDIFEEGATLTSLLRDTVDPSEAEMIATREALASDPKLAELVEAKTKLQIDGEADLEKLRASITANGAVTIDFSALGDTPAGLSFTPFGVRRLSADRTIYTLVPISATFGELGSLTQTTTRPTLEDRAAQTLTFPIDPGEFGALESGTFADLELELPGATLTAARAEVRRDGPFLFVRLLPSEN